MAYMVKQVKVAHTRLPSVGFRSWSRFLAVSLQVTWVINLAVGCRFFPSDLQLPPQPLRGLRPISLLGEQRHDGCEQFAQDCHPTASRLRFEPGPVCAWVQHANHSATEPPGLYGKKIKINLIKVLKLKKNNRKTNFRSFICSIIWPIDSCHFQWPWMTSKVIRF